MRYGKCSSRQRPNDSAYSSRAPSVAREQPGRCRALRPEPKDGGQVVQADRDGQRAEGTQGAEEHGADAVLGASQEAPDCCSKVST